VDLLRETIRTILEHYVLEERVKPQAYERAVIRALKQAGAVGRIKRATTHDAWRPDADIRVGDEFHYVEVKANSHAQMGGGSVSYVDGRFEAAGKSGMLLAINRTFESDVRTIAQHYARKNTFYIQIGGAGLFRLGEANPANLPVPVLTGKVQLEVRLAKAGKPTAGMRVQARLMTGAMSPFTLDDPESVRQMLTQRPRRPSPR